jgi:hypothetical protein
VSQNEIVFFVFQIDFVAHDEIPYATGNSTDVYADLKAVSDPLLFLALYTHSE